MNDDDALDRLEEELDLPRVLVITEDDDSDVSIECPGDGISENDRIAILVKALVCELGPTLAGALNGIDDEEDDG